MIPVIMNEQDLDLQSAVDFVGDMCKQSIDRFNHDRNILPSWGAKIDRDVAVYVDGLANWIVGSLHWSFELKRYFGKNGQDVKVHRVVDLLPRRIWGFIQVAYLMCVFLSCFRADSDHYLASPQNAFHMTSLDLYLTVSFWPTTTFISSRLSFGL